MIEYANEFVIRLLKQYEMLSKSLNFITDMKQKRDICDQMTKLIESVLEQTKAIYEEKYNKIVKRSVYLMDEEKNRLLELINLINERSVYVNNQVINNRELTGITINGGSILGEESLEDYKAQVKIIDKYKNNIRMETILKEELEKLEVSIKKVNDKINNNKNLNKQLEDKMIRIIDSALSKLSLYELQDSEKEIDLAYTELGYSLEKAKENAKIARRDYGEEIIVECDNMLSTVTLEYEKYKEKKLILKLIYIFKRPVEKYSEILNKREEINNILVNITESELYSMIGNELNKEYATIKLEGQDIATLKNLTEERDNKKQILSEISIENNSPEFKELLANLLENEKRHQEKLNAEKKKREEERQERMRQEEKRKLEEMAKRQKALEEERKKEIERRTKQLLEEKQKPVLVNVKNEKIKEETTSPSIKETDSIKKEINNTNMSTPRINNERPLPKEFNKVSYPPIRNEHKEDKTTSDINNDKKENIKHDNYINTNQVRAKSEEALQRSNKEQTIAQSIPVIKNNKLESEVIPVKTLNENSTKVFPDISLDKKDTIFPDFPVINESNSFFDEDEFNDLSDYMESDDKKGWF